MRGLVRAATLYLLIAFSFGVLQGCSDQVVEIEGKLAIMRGGRSHDDSVSGKLVLEDVGGQNSNVISKKGLWAPMFSPDGQKLLFVENVPNTKHQTVVYDVARNKRRVFRNVGRTLWMDGDRLWMENNGDLYENGKKITDPKKAVIAPIVYNFAENRKESLVSDLKGNHKTQNTLEEPLTSINRGEIILVLNNANNRTLYIGKEGHWRQWLRITDPDDSKVEPSKVFWIGRRMVGIYFYRAKGRKDGIYIYDRKTLQLVRRIRVPNQLWHIRSIDVSPDGSKLLLSGERSDRGPTWVYHYFVIEVKNGHSRRILTSTWFEEYMWRDFGDGRGGSRGRQLWSETAWLPDNRHFLVALPTLRGSTLWLADSEGERPLKQKLASGISDVAWSPN